MLKKILLIEDDPQTVAMCHSYLESSGYDVVTAADGLEGLAVARRERPDLIVLDLILPEMDGLDVCRAIRLKSRVPIIILSGRDEETDKVIGLEVGADDYMTKPFNLRELVARVHVALRHAGDSVAEVVQVGNVCLDRAHFVIQIEKRTIPLTPTEFAIMATLMSRPGSIFSRDQLRRVPHGIASERDGRAIDSHIRNLRRKLEPEELILTVHGVGYQFGSETGPQDA
jgi:DNA-binding response OmpR family regulator